MLHEEWNTAIDQAAERLLDDAGICAPPVDIFVLAKRLRIVIAIDANQLSRARYKKLSQRPAIFLKPDDRPERLQWAAAHELGEMTAWRIFETLSLTDDEPSGRLRETVANLFASRLLLPTRWFFSDSKETHCHLFELKRRYQTASHEIIATRLLDLPEQSIVTIFDNGRITRRETNFQTTAPRLAETEQACWHKVHNADSPFQIREAGIHVRGWPVHENSWKRELLRTTREADCDDGN